MYAGYPVPPQNRLHLWLLPVSKCNLCTEFAHGLNRCAIFKAFVWFAQVYVWFVHSASLISLWLLPVSKCNLCTWFAHSLNNCAIFRKFVRFAQLYDLCKCTQLHLWLLSFSNCPLAAKLCFRAMWNYGFVLCAIFLPCNLASIMNTYVLIHSNVKNTINAEKYAIQILSMAHKSAQMCYKAPARHGHNLVELDGHKYSVKI